ncbi:MAG: hypothetical protein GY732_07105, partial [Gammaproteobacteria bacterium]|nr:hypothetical protein [Gammaproteobacteria bacterium]
MASGSILDFTGGSAGFFGTVDLMGSGTYELNGGTVSVFSVLNLLSGATLKLSGDAIGGTGTINSFSALIAEGVNTFLGTLVSNSPLTVQATSGSGDASLSVANLTTDGQVTLSNLDSGTPRNASIIASSSFTNNGNLDLVDLHGGGTLTIESQFFTNGSSASINALSGNVVFDGGVSPTGFLANNGSIFVSSTDVLARDFSQINNDGTLYVGSGRSFVQSGTGTMFSNNNILVTDTGFLGVPDFEQMGGTTRLDGSGALLSSSNEVRVSAGIFTGTGQVSTPDFDHSGGYLKPGASPGTLSISGNYIMGPSATLVAELGGLTQGLDYDLLSVAGNATLDGTLDVQLYGGFAGSVGDQFDIISSTDVINDFATVSVPTDYAFLASADVP